MVRVKLGYRGSKNKAGSSPRGYCSHTRRTTLLRNQNHNNNPNNSPRVIEADTGPVGCENLRK